LEAEGTVTDIVDPTQSTLIAGGEMPSGLRARKGAWLVAGDGALLDRYLSLKLG